MVVRAGGLMVYRKIQQTIEYLLLQTSYGQHHWTPPKGHVDPGENEKIAAIRETKEEAGLDEKDLMVEDEFSVVLEYKVGGRDKSVTYWLAKLTNERAEVKLSHEHQDFKWLSIDEACTYARYTEMINALKKSQEFLDKANL